MNRQIKMLFLCILLTTISGYSQLPVQNIIGRVIDASTEEGLPFSTVKLSPESKGVVADSLGYFIFNDIQVGRYDVEASYVGYAPVLMKDIIVTS
ncbi:MAG: carboxypeptidase-like regulatory domain-containing protein, partial [Muribaculaceae bacterium]|nr:carboxypeptidase-like regulatory domain-containing protein [Muribaculaceae bacterium]